MKRFNNRTTKAVGTALPDYQELGITLWRTSPKLAKTYRSNTVPHAFLAGDAAHSFPPTGGLGMNTGIGDIQNLAWKINAVEKGWASDSFLDTFTVERWSVANENSKQSKINEENMFGLVKAIFGPGKTPEELWADEGSRKEIQDAIKRQRDHFDSINLVLGYVYGKDSDNGRGPSEYRKENVPGARVPHEWVKIYTTTGTEMISTLDFVTGHEFVLFTSAGLTTNKSIKIQEVPLSVFQVERDFVDAVGEWTGAMGLRKDAAVLVRPDQHIVGSVSSMDSVADLLMRYLSSS